MSAPIDPWIRLIRVDDCPPDSGRFVVRGDHEFAVFHLPQPDRFVVTKNACPHAGANLSAGAIEGAVVTCPWHHWQFNLDSGVCIAEPAVTIVRYESRIEEGWIWAKLEPQPATD